MVTTTSELTRAIDDFILLLKQGIEVETVILYGSYVHGNPQEWSDNDVAVISPEFESLTLPQRQRLISKLTLQRHRRISPIGYPSSEYHNPGRHSFLGEIIRTGKVVYPA